MAVISAVRRDVDAVRFIETVWQVQAAAVGLTIAVVVFAFQALASARWSVSLRDFADSTMLLPVVFLGSTSLVVDGLVLLGWGRDAPGGWAATWAVLLAGLTLISVPVLFISALRSIDAAALRALVLRRLDRAVGGAVERNVTERIGLNLLVAWCREAGFEFTWLAIGQRGWVPIAPMRAGVITDIRLRALRRLASSYRARGISSRLHITSHLQGPVSGDRPLLFLPEGSTDRDRRRSIRAFKIRSAKRASVELQDAFDGLHVAAVEAIRGGEGGWYNEIREAYVRALTAFPAVWSHYGQRYDVGAAAGIFPLQLGELDQVRRNVYAQLRQAVSAEQRDIAASVAYLPITVAREAIPLAAHGLSTQMLGLLVGMSSIAEEYPQNSTAKAIVGQLELSLFEFIEYSAAARVTRDDLPTELRRDAADFVIEGFVHAAELVKAMIDRGDTARVPELLDRWDEVLQYWEPEDPARLERLVELAGATSAPDTSTAETAHRLLGTARALTTVRQDIRAARHQSYVVLAAWVLRVLENDPLRARLVECLGALASHLRLVADRVAAAEGAMDSGQLRNWIMFSMPARGGQSIATDVYALEAFVVVTLLTMGPENPPSLPPTAWLLEREAALEEIAERFRTWTHWPTLLPEGSAERRVELFKMSLHDAASHERRTQRSALVQAVPDQTRIEQFQQWIQEGFERSHVIPALLGHEVISVPRAPDRQPVFLGRDDYVPKSYFLDTSRLVNLDDFARSLGDSVARSEMATLTSELQEARARRLPAGDLRHRVEVAAARLRADGYEPNIVIAPSNWRLGQEMGSDQLAVDDPRLARLGQPARHWFRGDLDGLLVVNSPTWSDDRIVVTDLPKYLKFRRTTVEPENALLAASIQFFDSDEALELVKGHPALFRTAERRSRIARAEELQTHGLLRIRIAIYNEVIDRDAAIAIRLPKRLVNG